MRGGAEKGGRWYWDGCRMNKRNSMTDFIACARHLREIGYAAPGGIVAQGVSAGGLLVCGAMNMAPQLWAGVIAQVPFVDMLNTMSDADHPLVPLLRPDWGDPLADPQAYDYIAGISPYENVQPAAYPPVLCTAGLKDDRVPYWEPAKLVANIRHHATGGNPAVLVLNHRVHQRHHRELGDACCQAPDEEQREIGRERAQHHHRGRCQDQAQQHPLARETIRETRQRHGQRTADQHACQPLQRAQGGIADAEAALDGGERDGLQAHVAHLHAGSDAQQRNRE
nr:prolyl oligopeptidase family serine peptidase [Thauera butanivorans]